MQVLQHNPKPAPEVVLCLGNGVRGVPFNAISITEDFVIDQHFDEHDTGNSMIWFVYTGEKLKSGKIVSQSSCLVSCHNLCIGM